MHAKQLAIPIALFVFDGILLGQGFITASVALIVIVVNVVGAVLAKIARNPDAVRARLRRAVVYAITGGAVVGYVVLQNKHAEWQADRIIAAVDAYHTKYTHYPAALTDVVPEFLPRVPRAKYVFGFGDFYYFGDREDDGANLRPSLMYVMIPPFGRPIYHFKTKSWGYLD